MILTIFFLITQSKTLKAIQQANRLMEPGMVWLQLIPLFGLAWQFIVVTRIADSLKNEFNSWQNDTILGYADSESMKLANQQPTLDIGFTYCILFCCSIIPFFGLLIAVAGLVCWIIYWVKLAEYKKKITRRGLLEM
jgi:hypothetical protein